METRSGAPAPPFFGTASIAPPRAAIRAKPAWVADGGCEVELRGAAEAAAEIDAWRSLARRALEPSLFAEPELLLPALQHLPGGRQVGLMLIWQAGNGGRVLLGLMPVMSPRLPVVPGEVRLWRPEFLPVAPALVDREHSETVLRAVLSFCATRGPRWAALALPALPLDSGLSRAASSIERRTRGRPSPSPLLATPEGGALVSRADRQSLVARARLPAQIRDAVETFLLLEAAGAKARGRAALIQDCGAASFLRSATRQLARRRKCRVELLHRDEEPAAAAILLESAGASWLWQAATPDGGPLPETLVLSAAASAGRRRKRLIVRAAAVSAGTAAALGLEPLPLVDLAVPTRPGLSAAAAIGRMRSRIDEGLRAIARSGTQRVLRA